MNPREYEPPNVAVEVHDAYVELDKPKMIKLIVPKKGDFPISKFDAVNLFMVIDRFVQTMQPDETVDVEDIEKTQTLWESHEVKRTVREIFNSGTEREKTIVNISLAFVERQNSKYYNGKFKNILY
jgi:hypothetical protein